MNVKQEIIKIANDCIADLVKNEKLSESDLLDLELLKESFITQLAKEINPQDEIFISENIEIYRSLFKAIFSGDEIEMKKLLLELLKKEK